MLWISKNAKRVADLLVDACLKTDPGIHQSAIRRCPDGELELPLACLGPNVITDARFTIQESARRLATPWHPLARAKIESPRPRGQDDV